MKRWISTILLFLLLGAVVNVAVAWGCALRSNSIDAAFAALKVGSFVTIAADSEACKNEIASRMHFTWRPRVTDQDWAVSMVLMGRKEFGQHQLVVAEKYELIREPDWRRDSSLLTGLNTLSAIHSETGWPVPCMSGTFRFGGDFRPVFPEMEVTCESVLGLTSKEVWPDVHMPMRWLPLRPEWPRFLLGTIFYATILWLLIPGPFVLRRHIRLKCGRCPKCGYDLRGQLPGAAGCPECGWNRASEDPASGHAV